MINSEPSRELADPSPESKFNEDGRMHVLDCSQNYLGWASVLGIKLAQLGDKWSCVDDNRNVLCRAHIFLWAAEGKRDQVAVAVCAGQECEVSKRTTSYRFPAVGARNVKSIIQHPNCVGGQRDSHELDLSALRGEHAAQWRWSTVVEAAHAHRKLEWGDAGDVSDIVKSIWRRCK
ncbi:hypothetical protein C2E23DRAFT_860769 [Lenzites betulinus]|nr:hypothetical protein C2E23DRAFT_860769 [Lenzites betulinus]